MPLRWLITLMAIFAALGTQGCRDADRPQPVTPASRASVEASVRAFTASVAHDVTQDGPSAWTKYFADTPVFFMAVDGQLAFPSGQAAATALPQIAGLYKHIQLNWGDDLRLDVLTDNLCVVATSYTEILELNPGATGPHGTQHGYFTAIAENLNNRWQFRDAHWSTQPAAAKLP